MVLRVPKWSPVSATSPMPVAALLITTSGTWPPAASPQHESLGWSSFSSRVMITVPLSWNHEELSTLGRLVFSHASVCWTFPGPQSSCPSWQRLGVIQTKSGALAPSRDDTRPEAPGYGRMWQAPERLSSNTAKGSCLRAYSPVLSSPDVVPG